MRKFRFALNILAIAVFILAISSVAHAQACRTWVSGVGDDVNPCSRTAPCKTFAGAISKTAECGEIDALDPGGFGAVTITKCITLDGTTGAGWASILASGASAGVIVNVTLNPTIAKVTLRNISINGGCGTPATHGVRYLAGKSLHIQNCNIFSVGSNGVDISQTVSGNNVTIQDTTIREAGASGISAVTTTGTVDVVVNNVQIDKVAQGISSAGGSRVSVRNSVIALCSGNGINTASNSETNVTDTMFASNATAITVAGGATMRLNNNTFAQNAASVANAGTVQSGTNNKFMGSPNPTGGAFGAFTIQ